MNPFPVFLGLASSITSIFYYAVFWLLIFINLIVCFVLKLFRTKHDFNTLFIDELKGKDDAKSASFKTLESIAYGETVLAFCHPRLLKIFIEKHRVFTKYLERMKLVSKLAELRNIMIIHGVNKFCHGKTVKKMLITPQMKETENSTLWIIVESTFYGIDVWGYLSGSNLSKDIESCTANEKFHITDQSKEPGNASDYINIVVVKNVPWVLLIVREYGPGQNEYAFPGGFKDFLGKRLESTKEAASREFSEEIVLKYCSNVEITRSVVYENPPELSYDHDPLLRFAHGMNNDAIINVSYLTL